MKALFSSFSQFVKQISKDSMLIMVCFAPILCGLLFKFGIPALNELLIQYFNFSFKDNFVMLDIFLAVLTPYMFCFISAMIILTEVDDKISNYLCVTPLGKGGYLISRLAFPATVSAVVSFVLLLFFSLTQISIIMNVLLSILSALFGIIASMIIVTLAKNKVEGMALAKLTGMMMLGVLVPFYITGLGQYLAFFLPSFWFAKLVVEQNYIFAIPAMLSSLIWILLLTRKFLIKI